MRLPKRGERGFTLIELLIVVAILGVLAAVVIPNVGRFIGRGEAEAGETEFSNIQTAVVSMMVDNGLSELPDDYVDGLGYVAGATIAPTANMSMFPHSTAVCGNMDEKYADPDGVLYTASDKPGFILYQHDIASDNGSDKLVNYVATEMCKGTYYVDASGTVTQATTGYE